MVDLLFRNSQKLFRIKYQGAMVLLNFLMWKLLETKTDGNSEKEGYWSKEAGPQGK